MERTLGSWEDVYRNAKKAEKLKFEANERDEGELERTGRPLCIYEIYNGEGAWPFLHHGSIYRGITLVSFISLNNFPSVSYSTYSLSNSLNSCYK